MSENRVLTARQPSGSPNLIQTLADALHLADRLSAHSLAGVKMNPAEALLKIIAGIEMGFGLIESLAEINIIEGRPNPGAGLIAKAIRSSCRYDYRIIEHDPTVCALEFLKKEDGKWVQKGIVRYTLNYACENGWTVTRKGETKLTWAQRPMNMLFARCISDGRRWHCPDVLTGAVLADEMDDGAPQRSPTVVIQQAAAPYPQLPGATAATAAGDSPESNLKINDDGSLTDDLDAIAGCRERIEAMIAELGFTAEQVKKKLRVHYNGAESIFQIEELAPLQRLEGELLAARAKRRSNELAPVATTA